MTTIITPTNDRRALTPLSSRRSARTMVEPSKPRGRHKDYGARFEVV